ncbi:UTP6, small subunit (SSU) processome component, homolog (yeast) [Seminavis robusta]|uniref:UTP6, small subunit (SSU) processome component, homolog (Yeast) n=1 Tax=Seminavis robusta TaxID=568900 RepID=A0A9N8HTY8_9STRA|nr:UTP6, small subunit (SSU) processome component, homolog (yeast) [Seminavis robusta]|eukprot:Sro1667_g289820.1 UTP6, small subunit (SSU) processome component, homolog (yeast) (445) ;mRNA; r:14455-15789
MTKKDKKQSTTERCPFQRVNDSSSLTPSDYLDQFLTHGFLWVKGGSSTSSSSSNNEERNPLSAFFNQHVSTCEAQWTVENRGDYKSDRDVTPTIIAQQSQPTQSFYASTIIPHDTAALSDLLERLPSCSMILPDVHVTGGAWIFCGCTHSSSNKKKRKRPLVGRAEHVDEVPHSGTWHYQLKGNKTWLVRPHGQLFEAQGKKVPALESTSTTTDTTAGGALRLRITVEEGDWFVLNTRIWYHCTELEGTRSDCCCCWSISVARHFYLPIPCPRDTQKGEVVLEEDDIPDDFPRTAILEDVNCALAEVENEEEEDDDDPQQQTTNIVLVSTRDISQGELLCLANDNTDNNNDNEYNADERVDPRAVALRDFQKGEVVLRDDEIPDDLPRSHEPNCELAAASGDSIVLKALCEISAKEVLCILPDDDEEYETVEVDLATGELQHVE